MTTLTKQQRDNLHRLAYYLLEGKLKREFGMQSCSQCLIGHYRSLNKTHFPEDLDDAAFDYLCSPHWTNIDNTALGAGRRIIRFLSSGVPEGFTTPSKEFKL